MNESMNNRQKTYYADGFMTPQQQNFKLRSDIIIQDHGEEASYHAYKRGQSCCDKPPKKSLLSRLFPVVKK